MMLLSGCDAFHSTINGSCVWSSVNISVSYITDDPSGLSSALLIGTQQVIRHGELNA
jgi:hypothetical protein